MPAPPRASEEGFTLVEVLVSLALLAIAAVLVTQSLAFDRAFLGRIDGALTQTDRLTAVQDLLRDRLQRLDPVNRTEGLARFVDADGSAEALTFVAPYPSTSAGEQLQRLSLFVTPQGELRLGPVDGEDRAAPLLTGVAGLDIAYWDRSDPASQGAWRSSWRRQSQPPALIRIRLSFRDRRRIWPDLLVRPSATVDRDCAFDLEVGACRGRA